MFEGFLGRDAPFWIVDEDFGEEVEELAVEWGGGWDDIL